MFFKYKQLSDISYANKKKEDEKSEEVNAAKPEQEHESSNTSATNSSNVKDALGEYMKYTPSESVINAKKALATHESNKIGKWAGSPYENALNDIINKINNREKFSYDLNGDLLYQQYKDQYMNQGKLAMLDTIGQASAMTGGYGNSYAATVGNQAYQSYLQKLNDVVPELYQIAYDKYNQEGDELYNKASLYNTMNENEYSKYRDSISDWNTEANRLEDKYYNELNYDYGMYSDAYNRAFEQYKQDVSEKQSDRNYALDNAKFEETKRANKADEDYRNGISINTDTADSNNLKITDTMRAKASSFKSNEELAQYADSLVKSGALSQEMGDALIDAYIDNNEKSTYKEMVQNMNGWTVLDNGGVNWFGGIDYNMIVESPTGEQMSLSQLVDKLKEEGMSKNEAKQIVYNLYRTNLEIQGKTNK